MDENIKMSLKSFPNKSCERQIILCLSSDSIDTALKKEDMSEILDDQNILIIQTPVSDIAQKRSEILHNLVKNNLLKENQLLVLDQDKPSSNNYLLFENIINDFVSSNLKRANAYSRFFAALGAKSFSFLHIVKDSSDNSKSIKINAQTPTANIDTQLEENIKNTLNQIASINKEFEPLSCDRNSRYLRAKNILEQENLQNDAICLSAFNTFQDELSKETLIDIELDSENAQGKNLNIVADLKINFPNAVSPLASSLQTKISLASFTQQKYNFRLIVKF